MITRSNYEIYFIDYFDGKLDKTRQEELFAFLSVNADLEEEFNRYSAMVAEPDGDIKFTGKDSLKKEIISFTNYKTWLVGYVENDLSGEQKKYVDEFLYKNNELKRDLEILKQSRLIPDHNIIFDKKNALRRGGRTISFSQNIRRTISIAAALFIFILTYYFIRQINSPQSMIADKKENKLENKIETNKSNDHNQNNAPHLKKIKPEIAVNNIKKENKVIINDTKKRAHVKTILPEELKVTSIPAVKDTFKTEQVNISSPVSMNDSVVLTQNKVAASDTLHFSISQLKTSVPKTDLSEIFNARDLKELGLSMKTKSEKINENVNVNVKSLTDLATSELQKLSKATEIKLQKQNDTVTNSVTYALSVGNKIFISHKTSNN